MFVVIRFLSPKVCLFIEPYPKCVTDCEVSECHAEFKIKPPLFLGFYGNIQTADTKGKPATAALHKAY